MYATGQGQAYGDTNVAEKERQITGAVSAALRDAEVANQRLLSLLGRLRVSPPQSVEKETPARQSDLVSTAAALCNSTGRILKAIDEIEGLI